MAYRGWYTPENPHKYVGKVDKIVYRSLWERKMMKWCDLRESIIQWSYETVRVSYESPLDKPGKKRLYYVDFIVKAKVGDKEAVWLVEVKPKIQCGRPPQPKKMTRKYQTLLKQWLVNEAKWKAAKKYAEERGWTFLVLTEEDLNIK